MRARISLALLSAVASASRGARAEDAATVALHGWVAPGLVSSWVASRDEARGLGFELSAGTWVKSSVWSPTAPVFAGRALGVGGVFRAQRYDGDDGGYGRRTLAGELAWGPLGIELGYAGRGATASLQAAHGVHVSPYLSLGVLYVGPQFLVAPWDGARGFEVNVGLKLPLMPAAIAMAGVGGMNPGGRPLLVSRVARVAPLARRRDWSG